MMMEINCISCNQAIPETAKFCPKCGTQQKCKSCGTAITKGANNCLECGVQLSQTSENHRESKTAINTIKFKETALSREYEVAFTNEVGANVVDVVKNMLESQMGSQPLKLASGSPSISGDSVKTEDIPLEEVKPDESNKDSVTEPKVVENSEIPHINDVENTLECSEMNWILVYAFYISNYGKNNFSHASVYNKYKAQRETDSRLKNFSGNWKYLFKKCFKTIKDDEIRLTDYGIKTAKDLLSGKSSNRHKTSSNGKAKNGKGSEKISSAGKTYAKSVQPEEFDLSKGAKKPSLQEFLNEKKVGENTTNRILVIAYYITKYCKIDSFSEGNIEYAYKALKLNKRPLHLYQTILNAKNRYLYFDRDDASGKWKLGRAGEIEVDDNLGK